MQNIIWNLDYADTDHIPGKLSLYIGMPVMIKNNDATEICITKGQEGHVVGWQSSDGPYQTQILDTLFVKLDKPAKSIQLDDLPENVVPLTRISKSVTCHTSSDTEFHINRSQIQVLPNFAMTDYACQDKTRPWNVVDLSYCRDHLSYYVCLSRSSTSEGTVIVQGFNPFVITKGLSGYLKQEFKELELLNEITKLQYNGIFSKNIQGVTRNQLLREFQILKGTDFVPDNVSDAIKWSKSDPIYKIKSVVDSKWQIVDKSKKNITSTDDVTISNAFVSAQGSSILNTVSIQPVSKSRKRKADEISDNTLVISKNSPKKKQHIISLTVSPTSPIGLD